MALSAYEEYQFISCEQIQLRQQPYIEYIQQYISTGILPELKNNNCSPTAVENRYTSAGHLTVQAARHLLSLGCETERETPSVKETHRKKYRQKKKKQRQRRK